MRSNVVNVSRWHVVRSTVLLAGGFAQHRERRDWEGLGCGERCWTSNPPSTTIVAPVMYAASSEARKAAAAAMSAAAPMRARGTVSAAA
jgi:hypothetical protein